MQKNTFTETKTKKVQEHRSKLMAAIGKDAYNGVNLFEGTSPMKPELSATQQSTPLSDQDPSDAGVDISGLLGSVGQHWNAHMSGVPEKERK